MFSKDLEQTIGQCYKRAREARHEFMTVEHLLLALLDSPSAQAVLKATGADTARLRADLDQAVEASVSRLAEDDGRDTQPTLGFQRVLQRAVYHSSPRARRRSPAPTCWWRSSAKRTPTRSISSTSRM